MKELQTYNIAIKKIESERWYSIVGVFEPDRYSILITDAETMRANREAILDEIFRLHEEDFI